MTEIVFSFFMLGFGFLGVIFFACDWRKGRARVWRIGAKPEDILRNDDPALFWLFTIFGAAATGILLISGTLILVRELSQ